MTKWGVLLEFRHDVPAFEVTVEADAKADAIRVAEEAAVAAGYADAELRSIMAWPLVEWIKREVA